jgi:nucleotide-binding universal stress UspA family protein
MADDNGPILIGVDGSSFSVNALRYAGGIASALGAPLRVVTMWEFRVLALYYPPDEWTPQTDAAAVLTSSIAQAFDDEPPAGLVKELLEGPTAKTLIEESRHSRMLVLGTRGAGGFVNLLLGSVSATCAEHAHCPVLLVPATANRSRHG